MNTPPIPTEYEEQIALVHYLKLKGYLYFHVPNSTWTKSYNQKRRNTALGVSAGVPDMFVIVRGQLIAIELKRLKGGVTSQAQLDWIDALNDAGIPARVCKGASGAIQFIDDIIKA